MGTYINPGNSSFKSIVESTYVDKTGLISVLNGTIGTTKNLVCISRPRRFGKSFAAKMLTSYYDCSCDSHSLFDDKIIAKDDSYEKYINKFNVISLDITGFISYAKREKMALRDIPSKIAEVIKQEVMELDSTAPADKSLEECLIHYVGLPNGKPFVFIIDEWDAMIREAKDDQEAQDTYLNLLRGWFKNNNFTPKAVAAAYITGILPIKKDGSQSAISDFEEYSVLEPGAFASYVGFTEDEVNELCGDNNQKFDQMKKWYDGYTLGEKHAIYNPYSVMRALESGKYKSYWKKTTAAETLMSYIDMNLDGLQDDIARLIAGESIIVDTESFQNDVETFNSKDDVLTLLIHLGYLSYEEVSDSYDEDDESLTGYARIPNEEVRAEFEDILRKAKHKSLIKLVKKSDKLLMDTIVGNNKAVAKAIQDVHDGEYAPTFYNNEQSLRYVVKMAYISCVDQYAKLEELPSGHGIADVVFLPKRSSSLPAMIVELKWNKGADGAIKQIKEKGYPSVLKSYGGELLLVGINYDEETKKHTCLIEKVRLGG